MDDSEILFSLFYMLMCVCLIYPPEEFQRLGLTIEQLFSKFLGLEDINFIRYHQRRTALNLFVHSCLPAIYFLIIELNFHPLLSDNLDTRSPVWQEIFTLNKLLWKVAFRFSLLAVLSVAALLFNWYQQNWQRHPISQTLLKYSNVSGSYAAVATAINDELRRSDVYRTKLNSISTVIITENWLLKTTLYNVNIAYQSGTILRVDKAQTYNIPQDNTDTVQMVSITVQSNRWGVTDFNIRINALVFRNFEERLSRPILIPPTVQLHRNVIDRFIEVFKEQVAKNPLYATGHNSEKCFGCMTAKPNIKICKQCSDIDRNGNTEDACADCFCRPMWCVECMARWFAAKQSAYDREIWLQQKCVCPMCRARFCLLDVSFIRTATDATETAAA